MPTRKTKEKFLEQCFEKHGNKYDYSLVEYINGNTNIKIICDKHGIFEQKPKLHLKQSGCLKCLSESKIDQRMVIEKDTSYMIGLFQTDGNMSSYERNRGKLVLEISSKDEDIIYKLEKLIPYYSGIRKRTKNTKINGRSYRKEYISLTVCNFNFRNFLFESGVPYGKKSETIKPPLHVENLSIKDYVRGLYDGDGSLGLTGEGLPFMSFTTYSDDIAHFLNEYISKITGKPLKEIKRNNRDNIYNIMIVREDAVVFCNEVYYDNCLSLDRKYNKSIEVKNWIRPEGMIISNKSSWDDYQVDFILNHSLEESVEVLNRSESSIKTRLWRLEK